MTNLYGDYLDLSDRKQQLAEAKHITGTPLFVLLDKLYSGYQICTVGHTVLETSKFGQSIIMF
jgi:hypothetical protein